LILAKSCTSFAQPGTDLCANESSFMHIMANPP
jgi:hypothetical protein